MTSDKSVEQQLIDEASRLICKVHLMCQAAECMKVECLEVGTMQPYYLMCQAIWDFIDHTSIPEALWAEMRSYCPDVFDGTSLNLTRQDADASFCTKDQ